VDAGAIERNCARLAAVAAPAALCAVVKADGYGHGAVPAARAARAGGARWLAVATAAEAAELRAAFPDARLLTMGALSPSELDAALAAGKIALVHVVEGGFHLGPTPEAIDQAVTKLARRGVAYVILAHLFYRQVATNANALPFLPDRLYNWLFPQPDEGLSELGRAAVRAMVREHVLIDMSHMGDKAVAATLALLDEIDPQREVPAFASHAGFRFGKQEYMFTEDTVRAVAARDGLIGLIFAQHQLLDGLRKETKTFDDSFEAICAHIDKIAEITGGYRNVGLGTDFDGFIKPTLSGLESSADLAKLEAALRAKYGDDAADAITSGNARRLLRNYWRGA
jgi:microsomal dipeptidase-like Zn-dependent dipeptidase